MPAKTLWFWQGRKDRAKASECGFNPSISSQAFWKTARCGAGSDPGDLFPQNLFQPRLGHQLIWALPSAIEPTLELADNDRVLGLGCLTRMVKPVAGPNVASAKPQRLNSASASTAAS